MGAPVVHWEIHARDASLLHSFYSDLFGWKVDTNNSMNYGMVNTGSKSGAQGGIPQRNEQSPAQSVTLYAEVDDPASYLSKVESLGGRIVMPVTEVADMVTFAMFSDPEGNIIGLVKSAPPPPKPKKKAAPKRKAAAKRSRSSGAKKRKARRRRR
jgi:predicted enzyme related to lactoylglutathione lyase